MDSSQQFWDQTYNKHYEPRIIDIESYSRKAGLTEQAFLRLIGDVSGIIILEIGCGTGELSVWLAKLGARVTATDYSRSAIERIRSLAQFNDVIDRINAYQIDALDLSKLGATYDLIVGKYILHHVEPFNTFVEILYNAMQDNGRGVFIENSSRNALLMFARRNIVGRFGVPKYGDEEEHPLESMEITTLERRFNVRQYFPDFIFLEC
ncbi:MAG: class I SAM-dependent methyltransferase [Chloroflexales bacterium]|nr:class I SAM-dependent methyltransferase [Chloroflexales bacterium]